MRLAAMCTLDEAFTRRRLANGERRSKTPRATAPALGEPARHRIVVVKAAPVAALLGALVLLAACGDAGQEVRAAGSQASVAATVAPSAQVASPSATRPPATASSASLRPPIHRWPIPFGRARRRQMAAYSQRHYGEDTYVLSHPKVIVEHYTATTTARQAYDTFAPDLPDSEFHELPNTCAHFLVEPSGRIDQLVALNIRCRHTTGLNWTAIGIENVGESDAQVLGDRAQMAASLALTRWLRCSYGITLTDVIGHNESLSSPYHRDRVPAFQHQTHSDFDHADMHVYRTRLARLQCPAGSLH
jgi:N-acetylmuramoyl-L-alanine amidase